MVDLKFIRQNVAFMRQVIEVKKISLNLDELLKADQDVLELKKKIQILEAEKNKNAKKGFQVLPEERAGVIEEGRRISRELEGYHPSLKAAESILYHYLCQVPLPPSEKAPIGLSEDENVEIKRWGTVQDFNFPILDHVQILEKNEWADLQHIASVAGSRSYSLCNEMVLLEMALLRFGMEKMREKGFKLITVPSFAREFALMGTGHFPSAKDQVYFMPTDDLYLTGTAEVALNALHAGEVLKEGDLPLLYAGFSPCFRREAGSAGRDTRGLIRVHQFYKVEQFVIGKNDPVESEHWHQQLLKTAEEMVQELELPYRIVDVCTGDMGAGKFRQYDLETWVPSEKKYRETHSCSSLHDWQARRTDLRYRDSSGKMRYCHTLNNTAIATPRILVPFLENHQQLDHSIAIPLALRPFLGGSPFLKQGK